MEQDPHIWLEDVEGEEALAWVEDRNADSLSLLKARPEFEALHEKALEIRNSKARIPAIRYHGAHVYNFWQDEDNERGIWRRTTPEDYAQETPNWEIVLDVDALAKAEGEDWVYKGASTLPPDGRRCAIQLSRGGADAVVIREFDLDEKRFVEVGFELSESKGMVSWFDADTLYVATDFGENSLTDSGYPRIVKRWARGTRVEDAETVFEGQKADVGSWMHVIHRPERRYEIVTRVIEFYNTEFYVVEGGELIRLDLQSDAEIQKIVKGQLVVEIKSDWAVGGNTYAQGSLLSIGYDDFLAGDRDFQVVVEPDPRASLSSVDATRDQLLVNRLVNVRGELWSYTFEAGEWRGRKVEAPAFGTLEFGAVDDWSNCFAFYATSFLEPTALYLAEGTDVPPKQVKTLPGFFDPSPFTVEQFEATSSDGTRVPYFVVGPQATGGDGGRPTLLYAYGGFEISMRPNYVSVTGPAWLERGGVYAVANIRGGGEFGPDWHQSVKKENRQQAFEDFYAVAEDLVARGITSPEKLGIHGGSNGGLLVGAALTQRPDLFGAVVCGVPLLDMRRYSKLLAGASWMGEYGDPDDPEAWAYISKYSPYHNLSADAAYPTPFFYTSTRDDRVHPGHARKMVARMREMGHEVLYYENTKGGHAGATTNAERAFLDALIYAYLIDRLG